ncbi:SOS response-associated peptidase [Clostridium sp. UBA4548]|uniref:SOS response-associated peptidase n=1 Tax=Clostridium sp. UBA4548 TaxID=1946361 RepID=UPI0025BCC39A|nr:SOS response-associated peptidase [Clostridium sp. UBA4548]
MCGRFLLNTSLEDLQEYYNIVREVQYNNENKYSKGEIFPSNASLVMYNNELKALSWGFPTKDKLMINGRCETIFQRPMFSYAMEHSRCLIPVNSFYEWKNGDKHSISIKTMPIFSLGGIVKRFVMKDGTFEDRFLILTTEANEEIKSLHHRMPLIIDRDLEREFLNSKANKECLRTMLKPYTKNTLNITALSDAQQLSLF